MRRWLLVLCLALACGSTPRRPTTPLPTSAQRPPSSEYSGTLHVRRWGDSSKPPLVMVHGLGDNASTDFNPVGESLAEHFYVLAPDLPGFGESPAEGHSFHPSDYAEVIHAWMRSELAGQPCRLLGHSMGGAIAALIAGRHPESVSRLVLVDVAGVLHREAFAASLLIDPLRDNGGSTPSGVAETMLRVGRSVEPDPEMIIARPRLRSALLGDEPGKVAALSLIVTDTSEALASISAPTLLLWGERDQIAPTRTAHLLVDRIADARLLMLPEVGHVPMTEATERFVAEVIGHLQASGLAAERRDLAQGSDYLCDGESGVELEGAYRRVELRECRGVTIRDAHIAELVVTESEVVMTNVQIRAPTGTAATMTRSKVRVTGGSIEGAVGMLLSKSDLDLAGAQIRGTTSAFLVDDEPTRVLFSVTVVQSGSEQIHAHGNVALAAQ